MIFCETIRRNSNSYCFYFSRQRCEVRAEFSRVFSALLCVFAVKKLLRIRTLLTIRKYKNG
jgi:hypothetical protein